jgi:Leucine-rich repeat (LRR) protein
MILSIFHYVFLANLSEYDSYVVCRHNYDGPMTRNLKIRQTDVNYTEDLRVDFSPSPRIFAGIGENFLNLINLEIIEQKIRFVERGNFVGLTKLETLNLGTNEISSLPEDAFFELTNLRRLFITDNQIKQLPSRIFSNLQKIELIGTVGNQGNILSNIDFSTLPADLKVRNDSQHTYYQRNEKYNWIGARIY